MQSESRAVTTDLARPARRHTAVWATAMGVSTAIALAIAPAAGATTAAASTPTVHVKPAVVGHVQATSRVAPLSTTDCLAQIGISCYSPLQLRSAYDTAPAYAAGYTGKGRTILIVDSFGSPTIQQDLETFDAQWGFPNTAVEVVKAGNVPAFDPNDDTMVGWAQETTLDVEYAHAMAPDAHIVLAETPVAETEGVTGLPEMMTIEKQLVDRGNIDVVTQSFGATENTFPGFDQGNFASIMNLRYAFADAFAHGTTVLASSGDNGVTSQVLDGSADYPFPANSWPSSDPLVTSVGGTQMHLDNAGNRLSPDVVWNDGFGAGGGGLSHVFSRPIYQAGVRSVVGTHRGTPDVSMNAAVDGGVWVYYSFVTPTSPWHIFGGTSAASPILSGVVAVADQAVGHRLGLLNVPLYTLGALSKVPLLAKATGIVDVTSGDISFAGVTGPAATRGYDLASGWGTVDVARLVKALAPASRIHP